jgi:N-acetylglucosaminyldiphosphoundecaprenol N-acetyl-beta-D-mannosaminyltransferase
MSERLGFTQFLYGGRAGVAERLQASLQRRFPRLRILGCYTPPFRPLNAEEETALTKRIAVLRPDIMWVGLSTPKQERFMAEFLPKLDVTMMVGVGAAFDMLTGGIRDAPRWVQRAGLQWLHRLSQEPSRLWRRYLLNNPRFLWHVGLQLAGLRSYRNLD